MSIDRLNLITRCDFDGLVCAVLLKELNLVDEVRFAHPKDMQDGIVKVTGKDIIANLPYHPEAHLCFDHHASELLRNVGERANHIIDADAPSTARVIYRHYGGREAFPKLQERMLLAVDKADSGQFSIEEVLAPSGWVLLSFLTDPRTGLERFNEFRIDNGALMLELIQRAPDHGIDDLLALPDVRERGRIYFEQTPRAQQQIRDCIRLHKKLAVLDLRNEEPIWVTNRFMLYALFPQVNISIHVLWGLYRAKTVFATGKSIFDRSSRTHVGELMLKYGGGGHAAAGTCQVINDKAESVLKELITQINTDG